MSSCSSDSSNDEEVVVSKKSKLTSSDSDSEPKTKKTKSVKPKKATKKRKNEEEDDDDEVERDGIWEKTDDGGYRTKIGPNKYVSLRDFKGKTYVDIREFYEKSGKLLPGKKGISMNVETWNNFKEISNQISSQLSKF